MKIALVSSIGGHLTDLLAMRTALAGHERFWVLNDVSPVIPPEERTFIVSHAERDWRVAWNVAEFATIFSRERPDVVLSTGAGPIVPAAVVARLAGVPVLYVEPTCAVTELTLTGKLMRFLATKTYVQWSALQRAAPWARYVGGVM